MTDPIGTAHIIRTVVGCTKELAEMAAKEIDQSRIAEVGRLEERVRLLEGLISEPSIERLAEDIAVACVDCLPHIRVPRHSAMVRLGERLRNPLPNDIDAALSLQRRV